MSELLKRILIATFGIPLILYLTYLGSWFFFILLLIISLVAQWEFYRMQRNKEIYPQTIPGLIGGIVLLTGVNTGYFIFTGFSLLFMFLLMLTIEMFRKYKNASINLSVTLLGIFYIPFLLCFLLHLRRFLDSKDPHYGNAGFIFILVLFAAIWICDTFAYFFGKKFGAHKLFKKVSPNKSMEGAIAGLIGSIVVFLTAQLTGFLPFSPGSSLMLGVTVGVTGQVGDLIESWFKRDAGVKDSSDLLPGHGGMLDRFDSIIFTSPVLFMLIYFILN